MRVLILNWRDVTHPQAGGAELDVHEFARRAVNRGHNVTLYTSQPPCANRVDEIDGYSVVRAGNEFTVGLRAMGWYNRGRRFRDFDVILECINGLPWLSPLYCRRPVVVLFHHPVGRTFFQELPFPVAFAGFSAEQLIPRFYRERDVLLKSKAIAPFFVERGFPVDRLHVVRSGLDSSVYSPEGQKAARPTLIMLGPLKYYKHPETAILLLESLRESVPDLQLVITGWGKGSILHEIQNLARRHGVADRVRVTGFVTEQEKLQLLREAWVLVQPSEREGWSYGVMEAAACGTPAVAYAVGGLVESVKQGVSGCLVPYGDFARLTEKVRALLLDPSLRTSLSAGGVQWSRQFSWEGFTDDVLAILTSQTGSDGGEPSVPSR